MQYSYAKKFTVRNRSPQRPIAVYTSPRAPCRRLPIRTKWPRHDLYSIYLMTACFLLRRNWEPPTLLWHKIIPIIHCIHAMNSYRHLRPTSGAPETRRNPCAWSRSGSESPSFFHMIHHQFFSMYDTFSKNKFFRKDCDLMGCTQGQHKNRFERK